LAGCTRQSAHRRFCLALRAGADRDRGWRGGPSAAVGEQGKASSWSPVRAPGSTPPWSTRGIVGGERRNRESRRSPRWEDVALPIRVGRRPTASEERSGVETASSSTAPPRTHNPLLPRQCGGGVASSSRADLRRRRGRADLRLYLQRQWPRFLALRIRHRLQVRLRCRNPARTASSPHREHRREEGRESGQRPGGDSAQEGERASRCFAAKGENPKIARRASSNCILQLAMHRLLERE
jgi:hypothetical protein